ncbi:MAG: hypothetical protein ABID38_00045 [Candidatus Diapherotrites archaeon]
MGYEHKNSRGQQYYLHSIEAKNGRTLFFFSKKSEKGIDLPEGYGVTENPKTGLPLLKKK